jgi:hypothetical protein
MVFPDTDSEIEYLFLFQRSERIFENHKNWFLGQTNKLLLISFAKVLKIVRDSGFVE